MSKPFLIIQLRPEDVTADNEFEKIKFYGGLADDEVERLRIEKSGLPSLNLESYAAIIVGGSPFDISTPQELKSSVQIQIETQFDQLFQAILKVDFPFLGCCSGNGLLGSHCGVDISTHYGEPVGGVDVRLTEHGQLDPLLAGFPESFRVLLGHKEACDEVPKNAVLLVRGDVCPVQMFRVGNNVYATQFHPEGDAEGFKVRIRAYKHHGYFPAEEAAAMEAKISTEQTPESQLILRRFVERFRN